MAKRRVYVTPAQRRAAQLLIERNDAAGKQTPPAIRKIATAPVQVQTHEAEPGSISAAERGTAVDAAEAERQRRRYGSQTRRRRGSNNVTMTTGGVIATGFAVPLAFDTHSAAVEVAINRLTQTGEVLDLKAARTARKPVAH